MLDELVIALAASLVFSCVVFFPLALKGTWVVFWLNYALTISIGIGGLLWMHASFVLLGSRQAHVSHIVAQCIHELRLAGGI